MILSLVFFFLILIFLTALLFYLFAFVLPSLKQKYDSLNTELASELTFSDENEKNFPPPDFSNIAVIENQEKYVNDEKRLSYIGEKNCRLFHRFYSSEYKNPKICIGFGDCVKVCPQEAIKIVQNRAKILGTCNGCGKCIDYCPENLISLVPVEKNKLKKTDENHFKFWRSCYKLLSVGFRGQ